MASTSQRSPTDAGTGLGARLRAVAPTVLSSVGAVAIALLVGAIFLLIFGEHPIDAYRALFSGAFGNKRQVGETLVLAVPLIFGGLAFAVAARAGMFNIGIEGQLMMGGLACGIVAAEDLGLPRVVFLPLALLTAVVAGAIWGALPGLLKARAGAHEVISTIMLNYIAFSITTYVINNGKGIVPVNPGLQATDKVRPAARLPIILHG